MARHRRRTLAVGIGVALVVSLAIGIGTAVAAKSNDSRRKLAKMRAQVVAMSLRAVGVFVPSENIRDFGAQVPVASNQSAEGRRKNRRVEVWVRTSP